jgi:hypothetical protein
VKVVCGDRESENSVKGAGGLERPGRVGRQGVKCGVGGGRCEGGGVAAGW